MDRPGLVTVVAVLVVALAGATLLAPTALPGVEHLTGDSDGAGTDVDDSRSSPAPPADRLTELGDAPSQLWPYTSRTRSVDGRTLAVNLVVTGDPVLVRRTLMNRSDVNWTAVDGDDDVNVAESPTRWRTARGAARYTYVSPRNDSPGRWVDASYQLGAGTYLGKRVHVRAYPAPSGNWTALQAHSEYWDWFRLRHTVTGVPPAAEFVGDDLEREPYVQSVRKQRHGYGGGGSAGWFVVVEFATATLLAGTVLDRSRVASTDVNRADFHMPIAVLGSVLGVRLLGLGAEALMPTVAPKPFIAVLYPILVAGPPLAVAAFSRGRPVLRTTVVAASALAIALVLDVVVTGVDRAPSTLVRQRLLLVAAFGLLAAGVANEHRRAIAAGVIAWLGLLAVPLFGLF